MSEPQTVSGNLLSIDERQRVDAITTLLAGRAAVLAAAPPAMSAALPELVADDAAAAHGGSAPLVAIATLEPLDAQIRKRLEEHAAAGGEVIVDTIPADPVRERLVAHGAVEMIQYPLDAVALVPAVADQDGVLEMSVRVPPAADLAQRVLLTCGELRAAATASVTAHALAEPQFERTLWERITELERTNRQLAQAKLGVHDAAATRRINAMERKTRRAEEMLDQFDDAVFHAKQNDELFQSARNELFEQAARAARLEAELNAYRPPLKRLVKGVIVRTGRRLRRR